MSRHRHAVLLSMMLIVACGSAPGGTDSGPDPGTDAPVVDTSTGGVDSGGVAAVHDCAEADFEDLTGGTADDRMIMVPRGTFTFDHPCITIREDQAVMFMWDFAAHPLMAGVAPGHPGESDLPTSITAQTTGALYEVAFPDPGNYAFYCGTHFHSGMYGVVRVVPLL
jgi:plastocyanin